VLTEGSLKSDVKTENSQTENKSRNEENRHEASNVITGASSGFGALAARALDKAGHIVCASMRETTGRNVKQVAVFSVRLNQAIEIGLSLL
jgi:NADP-dependent 3-hydroxy acid dehydrogenase YdfG